MLGLGIAGVSAPIAVWQGLSARKVTDGRRNLGTAGLVLGLFAMLVPASQVVAALTARPSDERPANAVACDCAMARPGATFEMRLVATGSEGVSVTWRGHAEKLVLDAEPIVTLADVQTVAALRSDVAGTVDLIVTLRPEASERLVRLAVRGRDIAVIVNGECVHWSRVVGFLPGSLFFAAPLTEDEACALQCAVMHLQ